MCKQDSRIVNQILNLWRTLPVKARSIFPHRVVVDRVRGCRKNLRGGDECTRLYLFIRLVSRTVLQLSNVTRAHENAHQ